MRRLAPSLLCLLLAGCGGAAARPSAKTPQHLFAGTCGSCHTLGAAGTTGTFGPNLDRLKPSKGLVLQAIKTGPGPMPAGLLTGADAAKVAGYVAGASSR